MLLARLPLSELAELISRTKILSQKETRFLYDPTDTGTSSFYIGYCSDDPSFLMLPQAAIHDSWGSPSYTSAHPLPSGFVYGIHRQIAPCLA
jgi:hypothetical protein